MVSYNLIMWDALIPDTEWIEDIVPGVRILGYGYSE